MAASRQEAAFRLIVVTTADQAVIAVGSVFSRFTIILFSALM